MRSNLDGSEYWNLRDRSLFLSGGKSIILDQLAKYLAEIIPTAKRPISILDIGCGSGSAKFYIDSHYPALASMCHWTGIDYSKDALDRALSRGYAGLINTDASGFGAISKPIDICLAINIYHEIFSNTLRDRGAECAYKITRGCIQRHLAIAKRLYLFDGLDLANDRQISVEFHESLHKPLKYVCENSLWDDRHVSRLQGILCEDMSKLMITPGLAMRIISKLIWRKTPFFKSELRETYQYFKFEDFVELVNEAGSHVCNAFTCSSRLLELRDLIHIKQFSWQAEHCGFCFVHP